MNARILAVKTITPLLADSGSLKYSLKKHILDCPENQRALFQELCYGSMRHYPQLEAIFNLLVIKPLKPKDQDIKALILIGLYQLYKLRVADHAAISETVDVCKQLKKPWACALVNACLRNFQRRSEEILEQCSRQNSFKFNHPHWFIEKLKHNWPDHWEVILKANDGHPPLTLRANTDKVSRETLIKKLTDLGHSSKKTKYSEFGLVLDEPTDITKIEGFNDGLFSVQDEAAQLAALLINGEAGQRILDACSAPGGKLMHLLEINDNTKTEIQGIELEQHRAARIHENLIRLGFKCDLHVADATQKTWWDGKHFDKILLDAPCSATGVIRRNPDIKILRKAEDILRVSALQKEIIANLWDMLAIDGHLVYATCSIFPQENEKLIAYFIKNNPNAEHIKIEATWGLEREYGRQLFPCASGHDGFYYAVLKKIKIE